MDLISHSRLQQSCERVLNSKLLQNRSVIFLHADVRGCRQRITYAHQRCFWDFLSLLPQDFASGCHDQGNIQSQNSYHHIKAYFHVICIQPTVQFLLNLSQLDRYRRERRQDRVVRSILFDQFLYLDPRVCCHSETKLFKLIGATLTRNTEPSAHLGGLCRKIRIHHSVVGFCEH